MTSYPCSLHWIHARCLMKTPALLVFIKLPLVLSLLGHGTGRLTAAPGDEHWDRQFAWAGVTNSVFGLAFHDGRLHVGGLYTPPGGATNNQVDIWDGTNWTVLPGLSSSSLIVAYDFAWLGADLYVGGIFSRAGGVAVGGLARWNGMSWSISSTTAPPACHTVIIVHVDHRGHRVFRRETAHAGKDVGAGRGGSVRTLHLFTRRAWQSSRRMTKRG